MYVQRNKIIFNRALRNKYIKKWLIGRLEKIKSGSNIDEYLMQRYKVN